MQEKESCSGEDCSVLGESATAAEEGEEEEEVPRVPPEKVLAPFLKSLKKRRRVKVDAVLEECEDFYLRGSLRQLLANLQDSFADPLSLTTILNETAELLRVATSSKSVNLYLTDYRQNVITLCPRVLQKNERFLVRYSIAPGTTLASYVAHKREYVMTGDVVGDSRFPDGIPGTDRSVKAALCLPVVSNADGTCIAVVELYRDLRQPVYDTVDLQVCVALCGWVGIGVQQNASYLKILKEVEVHRHLLSVVQLFFEDVFTFDKVLSDFMIFSKTAVKADKSSFYLMDHPVPFGSTESFSAEVYEEAIDETKELVVFKKKTKACFSYQKPGIPGHSARTGEAILIRDAYKDSRFDPAFDHPLYRTRSVIAFPVKTLRGVTGVLKLVNKLTGPYFTEEDMAALEVFAGYAALVCEYEQLSKRNKREVMENQVSLELLSFHMKPPPEDLNGLRVLAVLNAQQMPPEFFRFEWSSAIYEDEIPKYVMFIFLGSELVEPAFDHGNLASFALSVKKAHRSLPYHNHEHAFTVLHFIFNVLHRNQNKFSVVEIASLLIAALCHDVDHRGVTGSFLELKNDAIAQLYEEHPQEEHHYHVCLLLVQSSNLLSEFSDAVSGEIMNQVRRLILATNLSFFFRGKREIVTLINEDAFDWSNDNHRDLMKVFLMTCAEFSPNFKTFDNVRKSVDNFYKELFAQGDAERSMGLTPLTTMDRSQAALVPDYHLTLLKTVVEPCADIVASLFPNCAELGTLCRDGIQKWRELIALRGVEAWKPEESYVKEKKSRGARNTLASTLSSGKSIQSDQKSPKND